MSETWGYDANDNETLHIDINGFTSHLAYDDNQLTTQIVDHGATQVDSETWEYDDNGNVISYGDNNGDVTASTYDGEGRLTTQVVLYYDPTSSTETWFYDNDGNVTENIDPLGRTTLTRYNNDGYVTEQVDAAGTSLAATTFTYYDADDNLTEVYVPTVGSTPASTTLFAYDDGMQTLSVNAMGNTSTMWYDADGNMTKEIDADGRTQTFAYNAMGLETSNVWYTSGGTSYQTISYGYDSDGNMTSASDGASSDSMQYDPLGRLTQAVETIGSTSPVTLTMGYDAAGDRTLLQDSLGGTIDYVYDTDSELTTEVYAQNGATMSIVQDYDWLGRVSEQLDYSGSTLVATSSTGYNSQDLVTAINQSNGGSTLIASYSMMYDFDNELSQQIDHGNTTSFGYDALGEVTSYGTASRSYDANGNISGDTVTYGNEVTYDGTYHYQYDKAGNETEMYNSSVTWLYSYDNDNQMTQAQETSAGLTVDANYTYDAFGSQIEESVTTISGGTTTSTAMEYVLDHWNPAKAGATGLSGSDVIADMTPTGSLITGYVWSNQVGQLLGRYDTSLSSSPTAGMYYLFTDQNGSVRDIVNSSGADVDSIKYDAYGNIITQTTSSYQGRFTYDSYAYDGATGDYDVNARVYDPVSGRWLSQDPDGIAAGQANLYQYVGNDPTNATDPSGLEIFNWSNKYPGTPLEAPHAKAGANDVIGDYVDSAGNKLELFADKTSFYGRITPNKAAPITFGRCIANFGVNVWLIERNADGTFAKFVWVNIAPSSEANKPKLAAIVAKNLIDLRNAKKPNSTSIADDMESIGKSLTEAAKEGYLKNPTKLPSGESRFEVVYYEWDFNKKGGGTYRLFETADGKKTDWKADPTLGLDGKAIPPK